MKARFRELLDRAVAAMVAAIDVYNKPDFPYRAESFTILALNGWELLLKAKWLYDHNNRLSSLYVRQDKSGKKRLRYKRTRSGNPFTHSLDHLANELAGQKVLDGNARVNLEALTELRDTAVHFYHRSPELAEHLQEVGMACLKNFVSAVQDWFDEDLSRFNFYLMPLSFVSPPQALEVVHLNKEEASFLRYIGNLKTDNGEPGDRYSIAVNVEVRFVRSKAPDVPTVRISNDPNAPAVRLTEEQILDRYPWDYAKLTEKCRERYADFKSDRKYHRLRKQLEVSNRFAHTRLLDPDKPSSSKKIFFNTSILNEFDKYYTINKN